MRTMRKPSTVIILAAGQGMRLRPLTSAVPKALVSCAGWPLLSYSINFARAALAEQGKVVVVAGYCGDLVAEILEIEAPDAEIAWNREYDKGNLLSVIAGLAHVGGDFLLMNSDHIYPLAFAHRLVETDGAVVAAIDRDRVLGPDDMKVRLDGNAHLKAIAKTLTDYDAGYIGMTLVRSEALSHYRAAVEQARQRRGDAAVAEDVLQVLADNGHEVKTCDLSGLAWLEIDTLEDLQNAECRLLEEEDFLGKNWQ